MNRRRLLQGIAAFPVASVITSCRGGGENPPASSEKGTLKVLLNGPFALVIDINSDNRVKAFVPFDPNGQHELRFSGPLNVAGKENKSNRADRYSFELLEKGLIPNRKPPRIDQGFYDFNLPHVREGWKPTPDDYFVTVDLPAPEFITFIPPAKPVFFGGRTTLMPLNQLLEFRMSDSDDVRIKSANGEQRPLACADMLKQYQDYESHNHGESNDKDEPNFREEFRNCGPSDLCVLFGVGLNPDQKGIDPEVHAFNFFNGVLLPSIAPRLFNKQLKKIGNCQPVANLSDSPLIIPAVERYPMPGPRLQLVSSAEECKSGGIIGSNP